VPPGFTAAAGDARVIDTDALIAGELALASVSRAVCADVLDRVADPDAVLAALHRVMAPDGVVSFSVPSVETRAARRAGQAWRGFSGGAHVFYGPDTLQSRLVRAGFRDPVLYGEGAGDAGAVQPPHGDRVTALCRRGAIIERHRLSVIVPAFNEGRTFVELMDRVLAKSVPDLDIEIIIIESNSSDGTRELAQGYARHPRVQLVLQDTPRGKGNAVRAGLARASGDIIVFQDADLEYDVDDYDDLMRPIVAFQRNFVMGSRHERKGSAWKMREFTGAPVLSQVFNLGHVVFLGLLNGLYRQSLADPFTMYKVFRRDCLAGLTFECNRFDFDFEIVIKLLRKGYQPREIPVNYVSRGIEEGKKVTMIRDPLTWLRALARYRRSDLYASGGASD